MIHNVIRRMCLAVLGVVFIVLGLVDCGPGGVEPEHVITPAFKATCILIRAFVSSGTMQEVSATADELAPLVEEIIAEREATSPQEQRASAATVAFSMPAPPKRVPRRRCIQWHVLGDDGGTGDAGSDRRDAIGSKQGSGLRDGGNDGGERSDGGSERIDGGDSRARP